MKRELAIASFIAVCIWCLLATRVEAPIARPVIVVRQATMTISCGEKHEACRLRERMEKVKAKEKR
jgi:hypothetical protein